MLGIVIVGIILFVISYLHGVVLSRRYEKKNEGTHRWAFSKELHFLVSSTNKRKNEAGDTI